MGTSPSRTVKTEEPAAPVKGGETYDSSDDLEKPLTTYDWKDILARTIRYDPATNMDGQAVALQYLTGLATRSSAKLLNLDWIGLVKHAVFLTNLTVSGTTTIKAPISNTCDNILASWNGVPSTGDAITIIALFIDTTKYCIDTDQPVDMTSELIAFESVLEKRFQRQTMAKISNVIKKFPAM